MKPFILSLVFMLVCTVAKSVEASETAFSTHKQSAISQSNSLFRDQ